MTMAESSTKRRRVEEHNEDEEEEEEEEDDIDRISTLPDPLLLYILSFLPTRTSVAITSLVSRKWRNLWEQLQVFNLDDSDPIFDTPTGCDYKKFKKFAYYVDSVLALRRSRNIRKFRLSCGYADENKFKVWIRAATGPHLQRLYLKVPDADCLVTLPSSLFINCNNLVSLTLLGAIEMKVEHSLVHFPSLKQLKLDICELDSKVAFLSGCPVLETLDTILGYRDIPLTKLVVPPFTSSKRLKSINDNFTWTYFEFVGGMYSDVTMGIVGIFHSMVEAFLDVFFSSESEFVDPILNSIRDYIRDDTGEVRLLLRHSTSKWPLHTPVLNYPEFRKLYRLKFILPCFNSNLLLNVLAKCHMLQVLIIQSSKEEQPPLRTWQPESTRVSECLKSHLTYIHIEGYQGLEDELTFAEYILRNGLVLETMLVFVDISMDITNKYRSIKRLTNVSKGSVKCQLKFDPAVSS